MKNMDITPDFEEAAARLDAGENLFISGRAGTGKSTFLNWYRKHTKKSYAVLAPTGVSALNVRGQTIHSFFRLKPRFLDRDRLRPLTDPPAALGALELLFIDEISMVRADVFDAVAQLLAWHGPKKGAPFGGVQLCLVGDLYQLPPIVGREEALVFDQRYPTPYFFSAASLADANLQLQAFNTIFRQKETAFVQLLNKIRSGNVSSVQLTTLNQRASHVNPPMERAVTLTSINKRAQAINMEQLSQLPGGTRIYEGSLEGDFRGGEEKLPAPLSLELKENAQVMFTKNDQRKRWVNGTVGTVVTLGERHIEVAIPRSRGGRRTVRVERESWESILYDQDPATGRIAERIIGEYRQFPLMLAWAVTIHKSQGKTLERAHIDLGRGAFAPGQLYVALSRCRTLEGITLEHPVQPRDIRVDTRIVQFLSTWAREGTPPLPKNDDDEETVYSLPGLE